MISGANSYRQIHTFTKQRLGYFKEKLSISWRQAPSYSSIRVIIRNTDEERLEKTFRKHANLLDKHTKYDGKLHISSDGKAIKGSYDNKKEEDDEKNHIVFDFEGTQIPLKAIEKSNLALVYCKKSGQYADTNFLHNRLERYNFTWLAKIFWLFIYIFHQM